MTVIQFVLTAIFPGKHGLAGFIEAKDDESGGDNWRYKTCKTRQIITINKPTPNFYRPDALPVTKPKINPVIGLIYLIN